MENMTRDAAFIVTGGSVATEGTSPSGCAGRIPISGGGRGSGKLGDAVEAFVEGLDSNAFSNIVADVYGNVSSACPDTTRHDTQRMEGSLFHHVTSKEGRKSIQTELNLCHVLYSRPQANNIPEDVAKEIYE